MYLCFKIFKVLDNISDNESDFEDNFGEDEDVFDADSKQFVDIKDIEDF